MTARLVKNGAFIELAKLLDLTGTTNVGELDVAPVQPVYDLSRLPRSGPGYRRTGLAVSHPGASVERDQLTRLGIISARAPGIPEDQLDLWVIGASVLVDQATIGNWTEAAIGLEFDDDQPVNQDEQAMLFQHYSTSTGLQIVGAEGQAIVPNIMGSSGGTLPILLPRGDRSQIHVISVSTGAVTFVRFTFRMWLGPRFQTPPGKP